MKMPLALAGMLILVLLGAGCEPVSRVDPPTSEKATIQESAVKQNQDSDSVEDSNVTAAIEEPKDDPVLEKDEPPILETQSATEVNVTPASVTEFVKTAPVPSPISAPAPTLAPAPTPEPTPALVPTKTCCKTCKKGKACGDSCIDADTVCRKPVGCACNG